VFAAKVPQIITHEKVLADCVAEFKQFLDVMDCLGEKLGPLLLQFGYFNKKAFVGINDFLARLRPFLKKLPKDHKFAVEIRNKNWLVPQFVETLRERGVALALIEQSWMPRPSQWFDKFDPITADFTYVRWLGDRKGIEEQTKTWDKVIVDRRTELSEWADILGKVSKRRETARAKRKRRNESCAPIAATKYIHDHWKNRRNPRRHGETSENDQWKQYEDNGEISEPLGQIVC
jgi:uncharacterized protein YecE (DUF72 family)